MYGRKGCHLCEDARAAISGVCAELGEEFVEIDVDSDPALLAEFNDDLPVTLVDGKRHDFWRVSPDRLRAALGG